MINALITIAILFAISGVLVSCVFLRPVPVQTANAIIKAKVYKPAGTYWQQQVGANRGFRAATPISVAESYVLELYSEELDATGYFSVSPLDANKYHIGETVMMEYRQRGLPLIGYKTTVLSIRPK